MIHTNCACESFLHMDVGRLEATLVDVVEGEGLSRVSAVFVHLYHSSSASLRLLLLSSGCHDFRSVKAMATHTLSLLFHTRAVRRCLFKGSPLGWDVLCKWDGPGPYSGGCTTVQLRCLDCEPACFPSITINQRPTIHLRKKGTRYKIKGDVTAAYYQKPQSDCDWLAVCPTLLCVSAEILHKAMVTILSRFLCLTNRVPCTFKTQKKKMRRNRDNCLGRKRTQKPSQRKGS